MRMLCRRDFLASSAALAAFVPLAAGAQAQRLTVETRIGAKGAFRFVVDTGADRTVIADDVAEALGLARGAPVAVQGIARSVDAPTVRLESLGFGYERTDAIDAPVLPRAWLGADGYLGLDALDGRRIAFDFRRKTLSVTAPRHPQLVGMTGYDETVVKAAGHAGRLRSLDCHVDGVHAAAFVDSGAEVSVGNPALLAALRARGSYDASRTAELTGVTGGQITGHVTKVERVKLGHLEFSDDTLVVADLGIFGLWELAERPALFIGMDLLSQFAQVVVDYGQKEYRFEFARNAPAQLAFAGGV